ncbi:hypothetical protein HYS10_00860 [Candidatus Collierbacteria bacterium]|nr:hypothetical protein [Candidatus Collierbacteria bacterium]
MLTIVPAILPRNLQELEDELKKVWAHTKKVQLDVVDGVFAPVKTIGPEDLAQIDTAVVFDAHLMVDQPEKWLDRCVSGGVERVFGQVEKMADKVAFIADAQAKGMGVGLAYDIETPLTGLDEVINDIDAVLLLSVPAGDQGQKFDERVLSKIKEVRKLNKRIIIIVDGGLDEENIKKCLVAEWAEEIAEDELDRDVSTMEFVVGSHLLSAENIEKELESLRLVKSHK